MKSAIFLSRRSELRPDLSDENVNLSVSTNIRMRDLDSTNHESEEHCRMFARHRNRNRLTANASIGRYHLERGDTLFTEMPDASEDHLKGILDCKRNKRFRHYLKSYFPGENGGVQSLENVIRDMVNCGRITCEPGGRDAESPLDQLPLRVKPTTDGEVPLDLESTKAFVPSRQPQKPDHSIISNSPQLTSDQVAFLSRQCANKETKNCFLGNWERNKVEQRNLSNRNYTLPDHFRKSDRKNGLTKRFNTNRPINSQNRSVLKSPMSRRSGKNAQIRQYAFIPSTKLKTTISKEDSLREENFSYSPVSYTESIDLKKSALDTDIVRTPASIAVVTKASTGEENEQKSNEVEMVTIVEEIRDVCQQLNKCFVSVQSKIMESLLPKLMVRCQIGEPGTRIEVQQEIHFKKLQTVVLTPTFMEKMKNLQPPPHCKLSEMPTEHDQRTKFILLPRWEQQFLGLQRRQCENRTVLAYSKPTEMNLDYLVDKMDANLSSNINE
ncbi:hypothetical protein Aperf_G00000055262 [Anoplocephala perfoliata]